VASLNRAIQTRQLSRRVKELDRLAFLGQLAGGISHELRNPLGVIKNSVYYLRMVLPAGDKVGRHLDILEREVDRATRIVTDLLDFARTVPPARASADLSALVRDCLERLPLADSITVTLKLAEDLPKLLIDHDQLGSVLSNLITNAAQAMPEGGALTIETAAGGDNVCVAVADTGVGIAPEHLERIFQPLFTTKAKGIGLGLAVAKMLVEANGGVVTVESAPGHGSRFEVRFPVAQATS
jgi:signal transduction histidine kinase